jgi:hypothetical protein
VLVVASFVSHTVSAFIILPIIAQVRARWRAGHGRARG